MDTLSSEPFSHMFTTTSQLKNFIKGPHTNKKEGKNGDGHEQYILIVRKLVPTKLQGVGNDEVGTEYNGNDGQDEVKDEPVRTGPSLVLPLEKVGSHGYHLLEGDVRGVLYLLAVFKLKVRSFIGMSHGRCQYDSGKRFPVRIIIHHSVVVGLPGK